MSLIYEITRLVGEHGPSSVDDLLPYLHGYTRQQVKQGMQNAKWAGRLVIGVPSRGLGPCGGKTCAKYVVAGERVVRAVKPSLPLPPNSIFQLGDRAGAQA